VAYNEKKKRKCSGDMINPAKPVANLKPYFFAALKEVVANLSDRGVDVIRLDMGSPDLPPADFIIDKLVE